MEKIYKEQKKNNIIIKNSQINGDNIQDKVKNFISEKLNIETSLSDAYEIKKGVILAKIENWTQKRLIMEKKMLLKGTNTYIDNDLTAQEMNIQKQLRDIAKEKRAKGNSVKVGYKKIIINNRKYEWHEIIKENQPNTRIRQEKRGYRQESEDEQSDNMPKN